jgi:hypothetical protein
VVTSADASLLLLEAGRSWVALLLVVHWAAMLCGSWWCS